MSRMKILVVDDESRMRKLVRDFLVKEGFVVLEAADGLEAAIRRDFFKLMSSQSQIAAKAAGRAVDVSAEDFDDSDDGEA